MIISYIACKDEKEANKIATTLIKNRIAACVNTFPVKAMYMWKGKLEKEKETIMITTSTQKNAAKVVSETKKIHSYDIPCIIQWKTKANNEFERWVNESSN
jgi:periplasmic divalent cation tolerance protein